jgi:hypothetical protein
MTRNGLAKISKLKLHQLPLDFRTKKLSSSSNREVSIMEMVNFRKWKKLTSYCKSAATSNMKLSIFANL